MAATVGDLLRDWRVRRRLSQLDLSNVATVSARHLSFVETGRSKPSRELVLHLAQHLDVPLRERNVLLHAAGFAPVYPETPMDASDMTPVRDALDLILAGHDPYPAVVVDRKHDLVTANRSAANLFVSRVAPELLEGTANAYRLTFHPKGLAPDIVNLAEFSAHLLAGLDREIDASADADLIALAAEVRGYPGVTPGPVRQDPAAALFVPLVLRSDSGELRFFSTIATFGTALDITVSELSIESFFPADAATAAALRSMG
jgi:transcriptional regulator with XRE-family HTH domain